MRRASPLRYPGGKWRFFSFFEKLIIENFEKRPLYIEPYAGGASLALSLLFADKVKEIYLNDIDPAIHAFWYSVLNYNDKFIDLVQTTKITPYEWTRQRGIYRQGLRSGKFALGFATFFLNRTNHSGILNGGMIGGKMQQGDWRVDARFNPIELVRRLTLIASFKSRIQLSCLDAMEFIRYHRRGHNKLVYLDPPYFGTGRNLYYNAYGPDDHARVRDGILELKCPWLVSYDDVQPIRKLYRNFRWRRVLCHHTARTSRQGEEIIYFSPQLNIPRIYIGPSAEPKN